MENLTLFVLLTIPVAAISRKTLFRPGSHGFYRFFGWECLLWLFVNNYRHWFEEPFGIQQLISWFLLFASAILVVYAAFILKKSGKQNPERKDETLYRFEKTSVLVETGIYRYIRHPMYASLIYLAWGILLKNVTPVLVSVTLLSNVFFYLTAVSDERECRIYFGEAYSRYMQRTKRFIPWLF